MLTAICVLTASSLACIFIGVLLEDLRARRWHYKATHQPLSKMTYADLLDEMDMIN